MSPNIIIPLADLSVSDLNPFACAMCMWATVVLLFLYNLCSCVLTAVVYNRHLRWFINFEQDLLKTDEI